MDPQHKTNFLTNIQKADLPGFIKADNVTTGEKVSIAINELKRVMPTHQPPPHKSEKMFRRYEKVIWQILQDPTKVHTFNPAPLAFSTYSCRLRDSINSVLEYKWPTHLDLAALDKVWPTIQVRPNPDGKSVDVGPRASDDVEPFGAACAIETASPSDTFFAVLDNPEPIVLHALAILLSRKLVTKPVKVTNLDQSLREDIAARYDVGLSEEGGYVVIL